MKLHTNIAPRKSGILLVTGVDKFVYTFSADETDVLASDVESPDVVAQLVATRNFWPADEADFDAAMRLARSVDGDGDDDDDDGDDGEADAIIGVPFESNTPPASFKPAAKGKGKGNGKAKN